MHRCWTGTVHGQQERGRKVTAMYWSLVLLVAACCAGRAAADGVVPAFVCATTEPHPHVQAAVESSYSQYKSAKAGQRSAGFSPVTIPVVWHVISQGPDPVVDGNILDAQIATQIAVLNQVYNPIGFSFVLQGTDRTVNADWFQNMVSGSSEESAAQSALHTGNMGTLNLYSARLPSSTPGSMILGYAYSPWDTATQVTSDAVFINDRAVANGTAVSSVFTFNLGIVAVHEVGHWLGLYHTFNGGCSDPGDSVGDTRSEASAAFYCTARNSCPGLPGADPIDNFMDYTDDKCRTGFSFGQQSRMQDMYTLYRSSAATAGGATATSTGVTSSNNVAVRSATVAAPTPVPVAAPKPTPKPVAKPTPTPVPVKLTLPKKPTPKPVKPKPTVKVNTTTKKAKQQTAHRLFLPTG